jgi:hypothetical protein
MMGGTYIFALSYADLSMSYQAKNSGDPYAQMKANIEAFMVSGQYNGETFSFVGEYSLRWSEFTDIRLGVADTSPVWVNATSRVSLYKPQGFFIRPPRTPMRPSCKFKRFKSTKPKSNVTSPASPVVAPARRYRPCAAKLKFLSAR